MKQKFKYKGHNPIRLTSEGVSFIVKNSDELTLIDDELKQIKDDKRFELIEAAYNGEKKTKLKKELVKEDK